MVANADRVPCDIPVPAGLGWLQPAPVCQLPHGHTGWCDDGLGACWTENGSYGIAPSRYFGRPEGVN